MILKLAGCLAPKRYLFCNGELYDLCRMTINLKFDLVALAKSLVLMPLGFVFVYNFERCSVDQIEADYFGRKGFYSICCIVMLL